MRRVSKKGKGSCGGEGSSILFLGSTHKSFSFFHILYIGSTLSMILIWRYTIGLEHWRSMEERRRRMQPRWCHLLQSTMIVQQHLNHLYEIKIPSTINNHHHSTGYSKVSIKAYYHNHHQPADLLLIYFNHNYRSPMMTCSMILVTVINGTGRLIMLLLHPHLSLAYRIQQGRLTKDPHFVLKYTLPMLENRMRITIVLDSIHHLMQPISTHWKRMQYKLGIANDLLMPSTENGFLNKTLVYTSQHLICCGESSLVFPLPLLLLFTNMAQPLKRQLTLALLKPDICADSSLPPKIFDAINANNMKILKQRQVLWTQEQAGAFYAEHKGKFFYERLCGYMTR